jgi:integrase
MAKERTGYTYKDSSRRWYARVTFTNKQGLRRDIKRSAENEKAAKKILTSLLVELEDKGERSLEHLNMTFAELADYYIKNYLHKAVYVGDMKVSGVRGRVEALSEVKPLQAYFSKQKIRSITYGDIRTYKQVRLNTPTQFNRPRSISSVNKELGKLRRMLNIAVREQWLYRNPFTNGESLISVETHRTRILSHDEESRLFIAIDAEPKRAHLKGVCLIALDCALRRGEILTLEWSDLSLENRTITLRAFNTKTARSRTVALTRRAFIELQRLYDASKKSLNKLVFGGIKSVRTSFAKACKAAKISDFRLHDCRHTAITRMIRAGLPPVEVMRVSGHTTMSAFYRYANLDSEAIFRAATALDTYLSQTETKE